MPPEIRAAPLEAAGVRLAPIAADHREELRAAAADPAIWTHMPGAATGEAFDPWFDRALAVDGSGDEAVWVVRPAAGAALAGSTRFLSIAAEHRRVEIGHTWYAPGVWGGIVNPACKFALLRYAFETLDLNRVELKTDIRNQRSQAAIAKLGAVREGVFRAHMIRQDGSLRDSVYFAVTRDDWPRIKPGLMARLTATRSERS